MTLNDHQNYHTNHLRKFDVLASLDEKQRP